MKVISEQELSEALAAASGPVRVRGGGTRDIGAPVAGEVLEVGLSGIELYEPGALTLVVRAGTPLAEVEALLAGEGQRLAFEPMDHRPMLGTSGTPTIGGVVAANVSGPRRIQAGAARDFTLGARFVDGAGRVIRNGGRVMKNVTGYDLVKLMAGSWGTLGVLSEVSFKVQAVPETEATLVGRGLSLAEGVAALARALGSPYDVTGAAHVDFDGGQTLVRVEGLEGMVAYRAAALAGGALAGWEIVRGEASAALWAEMRDVRPFAGGNAPVWRVSLKPSDAPLLSQTLAAAGLNHRGIYDWGGGLAWLELSGPAEDAGAGVLRRALAPLGGHATLVRATPEHRARIDVFQPQPAPLAAISRGIKQKFDPRGILNPGLMGV
ncbi:FAD-binding protein [Sinisalibacter aestuarii]|uniref:2-hydroxy-acid oxidase n=1 Tax=Sinisalibacter aestuarii TaxID=2949426 RepID=A0ABQ5LVB0_9RHOB|nr:FAD-binding protein [Sinisalibacter aestuarii]GKY88226.1 2-hydroxy-acid oxidase [Sinisalibacter aestuarii]